MRQHISLPLSSRPQLSAQRHLRYPPVEHHLQRDARKPLFAVKRLTIIGRYAHQRPYPAIRFSRLNHDADPATFRFHGDHGSRERHPCEGWAQNPSPVQLAQLVAASFGFFHAGLFATILSPTDELVVNSQFRSPFG